MPRIKCRDLELNLSSFFLSTTNVMNYLTDMDPATNYFYEMVNKALDLFAPLRGHIDLEG